MKIQPYIVVPTLIEQPTWGGEYIGNLKGLAQENLGGKKIGQSYELFRDSNLSLKKTYGPQPLNRHRRSDRSEPLRGNLPQRHAFSGE